MKKPEEREERREEKRNVLNNVINTNSNTQLSPRERIIVTFSVSHSWRSIFSEFGQIARREAGNRGFSRMVLEALAEYNARHRLGNKQLLLPSYIDKDAPSPHHVACRFIRGVSREGQIMCGFSVVEGVWQNGVKCYSCKNNRLRKKREAVRT